MVPFVCQWVEYSLSGRLRFTQKVQLGPAGTILLLLDILDIFDIGLC
jgi:hypothetical protein